MKLCCTTVMMVLLFGCGTASWVERLDTGQTDPLVFTPRSGARPEDWHEASRERVARQSSLTAQLVFRSAVLDVSGSTRRISAELSKLKASGRGLASGNGVFLRYVDYGAQQLRWMDAQLAAATRLANTASEVEDPDMQLALLRLAGPRLEASMMGSLLLAVWLDFLTLADVALRQHLYPVETLFVDMWRRQKMLGPAMTALSSREHGLVEAAAQDVPPLVGHLTDEFAATVERMRVAAENLQKLLLLKEAIESITMLSTMRFSLPSVPPSAPALVGIGLAVGSDGVMMGTRLVVSAEWVELVRHLVRAGVLSLPVVSAAVRIQAGQAMQAQAHGELPRGVREALGDGPEVRGMHVTSSAGAGMNEPPRHHVMPKEFREWFEKRGFTDEMDIDQFCVKLEQAHHQAIHGGGDWKLGRTWPGEWNRMIMDRLSKAESEAGRMLTRNEVLRIVAKNMRDYKIPMNFVSGRGR
ncbi:TIGR02269 family lipoprotein [Archangium lipolyticum]|uniref:TIGR02269 family lipoprotein n=1 Tax=Archangium lipolyticum TaxID=2970465 RepID=UPI00214A2B69|nr:TIGR02269 family lipoprotein [Archangium lipolyticum]